MVRTHENSHVMRFQKTSKDHLQTIIVAALIEVILDGHGDPVVTAPSSTPLLSSEHCSGLISRVSIFSRNVASKELTSPHNNHVAPGKDVK